MPHNNFITNIKKYADQVLSWLNSLINLCITIIFYLSLVLLCIIFTVETTIVLMRYVMGVGFLELQDLVSYSFAAIVTLSVVIAYKYDRHVRVDVFRSKLSANKLILIEKIATVIFILPVFTLLLINAWPLVYDSFEILEGSRETGGLGGVYLVKGTIIIMCVMILLIAIHTILKPKDSTDNGS